MSRKGFTLIELMIIIACLGVILGPFSQAFSFYAKNLRLNDRTLECNRAQTVVFYCMKQFLKSSSTIKTITDNSVTMKNNKKITIDKLKRVIIFTDGERKNVVRMGPALTFSKFVKTDYYTFGSYVTIGNIVVPMYWRVGK